MAPDGDAAIPERCPDCGGPMVAYTLRGADAGVCERCGHVGIDADHTADPPERESWSDALSRFYAEFASDGDEAAEADGAGGGDAADSPGAEPGDEADDADADEADDADDDDADDGGADADEADDGRGG